MDQLVILGVLSVAVFTLYLISIAFKCYSTCLNIYFSFDGISDREDNIRFFPVLFCRFVVLIFFHLCRVYIEQYFLIRPYILLPGDNKRISVDSHSLKYYIFTTTKQKDSTFFCPLKFFTDVINFCFFFFPCFFFINK